MKAMETMKYPTHGSKQKWLIELGAKAVHCYDSPKHAEKCVEYCKEIAIKTIEQLKAKKEVSVHGTRNENYA